MRRFLWAMALVAAGCGGNSAHVEVPVGAWGGHNVRLTVSAGDVQAAFKCGATGSITRSLMLDSMGRFEADGTYTSALVQGGPQPAHYSGSISGGTMKLTITEGGNEIGSFDLALDASASFDPCNF